MDEQNLDLKLALEEMRFNMQRSLIDGDSIDQKINMALFASGLVLTMGTTLEVSLSPTKSNLYWGILIFIVILYVITVGYLLLGASPQLYLLAIASDWDQLNKNIFGHSERDAILTLLSGYVDQIQHNRYVNYRKVKFFRVSLVLLCVIVLLMMLLAAIP